MIRIKDLLKLVVQSGGSDLFLSVGTKPNIKVEGNSEAVNSDILSEKSAEELIFPLLSPVEKETFIKDLELNKVIDIKGLGRFRLNVFKQRGHIAMVARHIKSIIPSTEQLGLPTLYNDLAMDERGLVLIVGAAGSGKTTTMASMINYRNQHETGHILCVEDPIEILHSHKKSIVDQREVGFDTHSFSNALRNAMREAPDVIVIGEIRDHESMKHALNYAETGHLCLSTLHANNASNAIERILSFYPEDFRDQLLLTLSLHLKAIVSQRLVTLETGRRKPAVEVMLNTALISELIREGRINEISEVMTRDDEGCRTFDESLIEMYKSGIISTEETLKHAESHANVNVEIKRMRGSPDNQ
jgi:twitching motility protein PilU